MAKTFEYKKTTTAKLRAVGMVDADKMTIEIDGVEKSIKKLMQDFNGAAVTFTVAIKEETDMEDSE